MAKKFGNGIDLQNQRVVNVGTPSSGTDAANKTYVDNLAAGLRWKASVRVASTANVSLATPGASIDGVSLASGNRVLLKNQTNAAQNGIYTWTGASAALTRTSDANSTTLVANTTVMVEEGSVNDDTAWTLTTDAPIVVDTTALTFVAFGGGGTSYTEGDGIDISGGVVSVVNSTGIVVNSSGVAIDTNVVARKISANIGNGSSTSIAVTHNLGTKDVTWAVRQNSNDEFIETDAVSTDVNTLTLTFAVAPASNALRVTVTG